MVYFGKAKSKTFDELWKYPESNLTSFCQPSHCCQCNKPPISHSLHCAGLSRSALPRKSTTATSMPMEVFVWISSKTSGHLHWPFQRCVTCHSNATVMPCSRNASLTWCDDNVITLYTSFLTFHVDKLPPQVLLSICSLFATETISNSMITRSECTFNQSWLDSKDAPDRWWCKLYQNNTSLS